MYSGVGYVGNANRRNEDGSLKKTFSRWASMIHRCYGNGKVTELYKGVGITVSKRWHCYENYENDLPIVEGYDEELYASGKLVLDKDIKQSHLPRNKVVYSPETCIFVSPSVNSINVHQKYMKRRSQKVKAVSPIGDVVFYNSIKECSDDKYGFKYGAISNCINGRQKTHKGWTFHKV